MSFRRRWSRKMSFGENLSELVDQSASALHAIHPSWKRVQLGEIANLTNGFAFKSKFFNESTGEPIVRIRDVLPGYTKTRYSGAIDDPRITYLENGQIAVGMDGDFNCRIWKGGRALLNQRVCSLQTSEECYDQRFLAYALPGYLKLINAHTSSITVKHLSSRTVQSIPLPLPPLAEQQRIVEKIETLFAELDKGEEALGQVQKLLARYRQSVLKAAVTGDLTADDPSRWAHGTIGDLLEDIRYGTAKKCSPEEGGVPVLRIPNVVGGDIDLEDMKFTDLTDEEIEKLALKAGDVLVVRSNGSANLVGRGAVVVGDAIGMAYAGYLIRLRLDQSRILPRFLHVVLNSPSIRLRIQRQAKSTSGVHNLNSAEVKSLPVHLPDIVTQGRIVEAVEIASDSVEKLKAWCDAELKRSAALRQSILKDAFSGKLVPQDPSDESAEKLLARIRTERAVAIKPTVKKARA